MGDKKKMESESDTHTYGGKTFVVPVLSARDGIIFHPENRRPTHLAHPEESASTDLFFQHLYSTWDPQQFESGAHKPISLGLIPEASRGREAVIHLTMTQLNVFSTI